MPLSWDKSEDWEVAAAAALPLTGLSSAVGVALGGIEGPNAVHFVLWPGLLVAWPLAEFVPPSASWFEYIIYILSTGITCCWYWAVSYAVLKIWRALF